MKAPRMGNYLTRENYRSAMYHQQDNLKNRGYDWRPVILKRNLSTYLLADNKRREFIEQLQLFLVYLMDQASLIKKQYNFLMDKDTKDYN
jgi:hypothetical protein